MADIGDGWFEFKLNNLQSATLIFNDGNNQTASLNRNYEGWYESSSNTWFGSNPAAFVTAPEPVIDTSYTLFFNKPSAWHEAVKLYYYDAVSSDPETLLPTPTWPGESMTVLGGGWYSYTFNNTLSATVIFNGVDANGTPVQTTDSNRGADAWYQHGEWFENAPKLNASIYKPDGWGAELQLYYYNAVPADVHNELAVISWPGEKMTDLGNGWYNYTLDNILSATVIVNDGTSQTVDTSMNTSSWYQKGRWSASAPSFTVSFHKPEHWSDNITLYSYDTVAANSVDESQAVAWPGESMTNLGQGWYEYTFTKTLFTHLIFTDGVEQTATFNRGTDGWYDANKDTWFDSAPDFDNDGLADSVDPDDDNDGVNDHQDAFPFDSTETHDNDNDGLGDNRDSDDDNDGANDSVDHLPLDSAIGILGDLDRDNDVDAIDIRAFSRTLRTENLHSAYDLNNDGVINQRDTRYFVKLCSNNRCGVSR